MIMDTPKPSICSLLNQFEEQVFSQRNSQRFEILYERIFGMVKSRFHKERFEYLKLVKKNLKFPDNVKYVSVYEALMEEDKEMKDVTLH